MLVYCLWKEEEEEETEPPICKQALFCVLTVSILFRTSVRLSSRNTMDLDSRFSILSGDAVSILP